MKNRLKLGALCVLVYRGFSEQPHLSMDKRRLETFRLCWAPSVKRFAVSPLWRVYCDVVGRSVWIQKEGSVASLWLLYNWWGITPVVSRSETGLWSVAKYPLLSMITLLGTGGARWRLDHEQIFPGKKAGRLPALRLCMQCCQDPSSGKSKGSGRGRRWMSHLTLWWKCSEKLHIENPIYLCSNATGVWIARDSRYRWTSSPCYFWVMNFCSREDSQR